MNRDEEISRIKTACAAAAIQNRCGYPLLSNVCRLHKDHQGPHDPCGLEVAGVSQTKTQADSVAFKDDKVPMELVDMDFIHDIAKQFKGGLVGGRVPDGWKDLDPAVYREKCYGAALRHMRLARHGNRELDSATKATHLAAVCANMMMVWWFEGQLSGKEGEEVAEPMRFLELESIDRVRCSRCRWWLPRRPDPFRGFSDTELQAHAEHDCNDYRR